MRNTNKKTSLAMLGALLCAISSASQVASAEDYQFQGSGYFVTGDSDRAGKTDSYIEKGAVARFYFAPVDTSIGPLATAAFVDRASSFAVGYSKADIGAFEARTKVAALNLRDKDSGWTANLRVSDSDRLEDHNDPSSDGSVDNYGISVGKYVAQNTAISLGYDTREVEFFENGSRQSFDSDSYSLSIFHVGLGDTDFDLGASIELTDTAEGKEEITISFGGAVYPSKRSSIGVSVQVTDADIDNDYFSVYGQWFATPTVSGSIEYFISDANNFRIDGLAFSASWRL